jgi:hypothetical protein
MALSKFLFTSSERQDGVLGPIKKAGDVPGSLADNGSKEFGSFKESRATQYSQEAAGKTGAALASSGTAALHLLGSGASYLGAAVTSPLALLKLIPDQAKKVFYQEMYLNPSSMKISYHTPNTKKETVGGVIVNHWRAQVPVAMFSGAVGWIKRDSLFDAAINDSLKALVSGGDVGAAFGSQFSGFKDINFKSNVIRATKQAREKLKDLVNSPRKFMDELQNLALSPMYYADSDGIERYNTKKIVIFSKRYPDGAVLEGYFDEFSYAEAGKDSETIKYEFKFVILNIKPVSLAERLGQFIAPFYGSALEIGDAASNISSFLPSSLG